MRLYLSADSFALALGADDVAAALRREADARGLVLEIVRTGSRGMAFLEPLAEIDTPDGRVGFGPLVPSDAPSLLAAIAGDGSHPKAIDLVEAHPFMARQTRLTFARCGLIDPLSLADYRAHDGFKGLAEAVQRGPAGTIELVTKSGLRGRGGAGFPTGIKWKSAFDAADPVKYVVVNADEGDSGTFADRMLMEGDPFCLLEGAAIAAFAIGSSKVYIYSRSEYPQANKVMAEAIRICADVKVWPFPLDIELRIGAGAYVCGEETALLESIEGKRALVRAKPPLPVHKGLFGRPTIINNVLSLAAAPYILLHGAEAYQKFGVGRSRGTMPIQLAGNVKYGGLFEAPFGLSLGEIVNEIGGGTLSGRPVKAVQVGGPLGAYFPPALFDTSFDYEAFAARDGLIGHAGVVVFDDTADMAAQARFAMEFCAIESCGKCTPCRIGSTRGVETVDKILAGERTEENLLLLRDLCSTMKFGSLCALGGFTPYPVLSALNHFPADFAPKTRSPVRAEP